jgi:hypothetical protein
MRTDGSLVGTRRGPISAIGRRPRRRHEDELRVGAPTSPWKSGRLPRALAAGDPRRTLFRTLLRRAEGVPVEFADGRTGVVEEVVFSALGFDFWPAALVVGIPDDRRRVPVDRIRHVPVERVQRIDVHTPRIVIGPMSREPLEGVRDERVPDEQRLLRLQRRHDSVDGGVVLPRSQRREVEAPVGSR